MTREYQEVLSLLVQLPIVGIFIWIVFRFMKEHREEREKISAQYREERAEMSAEFSKSMDKSSTAITNLGSATQQFHTEVREWRRENQRHAQ